MTFLLFLQIAIMNNTETMQVEMPVSFADISPFADTRRQDKPCRLENKTIAQINNYLKTPEEIEAELCLEMNSKKAALAAYNDLMDPYGIIFRNRSDNAYGPEQNPSGFMEENY
jgi:hypothetical protein